MILELKKNTRRKTAEQAAEELSAICVENKKGLLLVTPSALKSLDEKHRELAGNIIVLDSDIQLASKKYLSQTREVELAPGLVIGGKTKNTVIITGPCSVESLEQITQSARLCVKLGVKILRAGAFKPRTSPYSFQGMGLDGLKLLDKMRKDFGLKIITEVRDSTHVNEIIAYSDIIQIGAKSMYDHGILRTCSKSKKPVLLKRGFGTTLQEFVQAAEFILSGGNENVILCERGIRTFETKTRFTLDLCGTAYLKENTNLPVILDPSHAIGYAYGVPDLTRACMAMGVDGLLIETHPDPKNAKSDASQQLNHRQFSDLYKSLKPIARAVGRKII